MEREERQEERDKCGREEAGEKMVGSLTSRPHMSGENRGFRIGTAAGVEHKMNPLKS
jgi:hypothetical protein